MPAQGVRLTPVALRLPEDFRRLQPSLQLLHHPGHARRPGLKRPIGEVMREAEALVKAGVKELLVISQDTSAYGVDLRYRTDFVNGRPVKTRMTELVQAALDARRVGPAALCLPLSECRRGDSADGRRP